MVRLVNKKQSSDYELAVGMTVRFVGVGIINMEVDCLAMIQKIKTGRASVRKIRCFLQFKLSLRHF